MTGELIKLETIPENKESIDTLRRLGAELQQKGVASALRFAAKPLALAMKATAPDDQETPGTRLSEAINVTKAKKGTRVRTGAGDRFVDVSADELGLVVGPNKRVSGGPVGYLAWFLEHGTKPHAIKPRASKKTFKLQINGSVISGVDGVQHPGVKARHWMGNAFTAASGQVESGFYTGLQRWIKRGGY